MAGRERELVIGGVVVERAELARRGEEGKGGLAHPEMVEVGGEEKRGEGEPVVVAHDVVGGEKAERREIGGGEKAIPQQASDGPVLDDEIDYRRKRALPFDSGFESRIGAVRTGQTVQIYIASSAIGTRQLVGRTHCSIWRGGRD